MKEILLDRILKERFGHEAFRPRQREPIEAVLSGADVAVVMPTGEGKSLLYQLPALVLPGTTLVVSPLIALMEDQTRKLKARGIAAECVHSQLSPKERERRMQEAAQGRVKLLYLTPERFRVPAFADVFPALDVSLFAVDEAHCISQWGHDFRPEYSKLGLIRGRLKGAPPAMALTATAPPAVLTDIITRLNLKSPRVFNHGIDRPNLFLSVMIAWNKEDKLAHLVRRLRRIPGAAIIYCALISDVLEMEAQLRIAGFRPEIYHGKMTPDERDRQLDHFLETDTPLMVATNAFGMGVDRADIRAVYHFTIPARLESYYQEIGRVGRDGKPSLCELLYLEEDLAIQRQFIGWNNPDADFLYRLSNLLESQRGRLKNLDIEHFREQLVYKHRNDRRIETALQLFRSWGVVDGTFEDGDIVFVRPLDDETLRENQPPDKMQRALEVLLTMARYATSEEACYKRALSGYFAAESAPCENTCAACRPVEEWIEECFPAVSVAPRPAAAQSPRETPPETSRNDGDASEDAPFRRGDWVRAGRRYARVMGAQRVGNGYRLDVEFADDLKRATLDTRRTSVTIVR